MSTGIFELLVIVCSIGSMFPFIEKLKMLAAETNHRISLTSKCVQDVWKNLTNKVQTSMEKKKLKLNMQMIVKECSIRKTHALMNSFRYRRRRKAGRGKGQRRMEPFQLALSNRFQGNWNRPWLLTTFCLGGLLDQTPDSRLRSPDSRLQALIARLQTLVSRLQTPRLQTPVSRP